MLPSTAVSYSCIRYVYSCTVQYVGVPDLQLYKCAVLGKRVWPNNVWSVEGG